MRPLCKSLLAPLLVLLPFQVHAKVWLTEIQSLTYPTAIKNNDKASRVVLTWKGGLGGSTNVELLDSYYHQAKYRIQSNSTRPITIDIANLGNEPRVNLRGFKVRYRNRTYNSFPVTNLDNPGREGEEIWIGATIKAGKRAKPGLKLPAYWLEVTDN
ncbi:hypothetical protein [Ferrimonas sp.]|uniref:hypothetical protein n=1 Tax=Ferrimonas sp. TaxID=2080861 RepID=UPI003A8E111C